MIHIIDKFYWTNDIKNITFDMDKTRICCLVLLSENEIPDRSNIFSSLEYDVFYIPVFRYSVPSEVNIFQIKKYIVSSYETIVMVCDDMQRSLYVVSLFISNCVDDEFDYLDSFCEKNMLNFKFTDSITREQDFFYKKNKLNNNCEMFDVLCLKAIELNNMSELEIPIKYKD